MRPRSRASLSLDNYTSILRTVGPTTWRGNPNFQHPHIVRNCMCPDGKRRTAYLLSDTDTYFSWPARIQIKRVWIKGFVTTNDDPPDAVFTANKTEQE